MIASILQFILARGAGDAALRRYLLLAAARGDGLATELCSSVSALSASIGIREEVATNIRHARHDAEKLADELNEHHVEVIWVGAQSYPERLLRILGSDAPPVLFVRGNKQLLHLPSVGFCGSRHASDKGLGIAAQCALLLARKGISVVSGYAHGVDMAAHVASVSSGGATVFVLAEGLLRFEVKRELVDLLSESNHLVVSHFPPRLTWSGHNAMKRNRTIIGLSDAMILVESGINGGTFAAGEETLKRRRPLFVIDFADPGSSAKANPEFIRRGGMPIRGNGKGLPNLTQVEAAVSAQSWRYNTAKELSLF